MGVTKPAMFIGSSVEGKRVAETIQSALEYEVHSTVWHQGVFGLSGGTLESLVSALNEYDFATLVLTADDLLERRNTSGRSPRDNVVFELGLFMGALGRSRTFIVHSRTNPPMLPTDLAGITPATYEDRSNLEAALGPASTKIRKAIESQGLRPRLSGRSTKDAELAQINQILNEHHAMLSNLFQRLTVDRSATGGSTVPTGVDFLEGVWTVADSSHYYCRVVDGRPYIVYCFEGNSEATGEYFDIRRIGDDLLGRFRWFDGGVRGFVWLRIESLDHLHGAWWMEQHVPAHAQNDPALLRMSKGMNLYAWKRQHAASFPAWATAAFPRPR